MPTTVLEKKINALPQSAIDEVSDFVDFIYYKLGMNKEETSSSKKGGFGCLKDIPCRMSDDFDAPLEDFKEYM